MFDEIEKERKEIPRIDNFKTKILDKRKLNFYQLVAFIVLIVGFIGAILIGNIIPSCSETNVFGQCNATGFNISLSLLSCIGVFLFSLFLYSVGHIINILESIDNKLK